MTMLRALFFVVLFFLFSTAGFSQTESNASHGGMIDPRPMAGSDIGAKVNEAIAGMPANGGTVRIPAGDYTFSTTIKLTHPGQHLICDAGATLHYTGTGDAILVDPNAGPDLGLEIDGEGGCRLIGTAKAQNGIHLRPGNMLAIRGMRILGFNKGNGIALSGANSVQIFRNTIYGNQHGIDMVTVRGYAPNAVHVSDNEIASNDWGVYSHNAHVVASRALGNVYRDNVLEGNRLGDLFLGWDAHTLVEGNYFESDGVGVAAGTGGDKVYDIHVARNYFTIGGYRSEVELGDVAGAFVEGNYAEGPANSGTDCAVNVVPGIRGGASNVLLRSAFSRVSERNVRTREFCYEGKPEIPPGIVGEERIIGNIAVDGTIRAKSAQLNGPLELSQGSVASTSSAVRTNDACSTEGMLLISRPAGQAARLFFCSGFKWQPVALPHH